MTDADSRPEAATKDPDTFPLWTIRYTWAVLDSDDEAMSTYVQARSKTEAIERAVFTLDHYDNSGTRLLVLAEVKDADGWSEVPKPDKNFARHSYLYAFQQPPAELA